MALIPYSPDDVIGDYGGQQLHGFQKGTFISVKHSSDLSKLSKGADGEPVLIRLVDDSAEIEITLQQDSASNDWLTAQATLFRQGGGGILPFMLKDLTGRTMLSAARCWIKAWPDVEYSDDESARKWTLVTDALQSFVGGRG